MWLVNKKFLRKKYGAMFPIFTVTILFLLLYTITTNLYVQNFILKSVEILSMYAEKSDQYINNSIKKARALLIDSETYRKKIEELKEELKDYERVKIEINLLKNENNNLKNQLNFVENFPVTKISARLFINQKLPYLNFGIINAGSTQGVKNNSCILSDVGLVGRILEVMENYSKILLITDPSSKVPVLGSISGQKGVFVGGGRGLNSVLYVEDPTMLKIDEVLVTSGEDSYFIGGIPVAKVAKIDHDVVYAESFFTKNSTVTVIIKSDH